MAEFAIGDMLEQVDDTATYLFPANNTLNMHGHLIMGRGAALAFKKRWKWLPEALGSLLSECRLPGCDDDYGIVTVQRKKAPLIGAFQVKRDWRDPALLELIQAAVQILLVRDVRPRIHLAYPGIGNGGLKEEDVRPILETLPDSVTIWRLL